MLEALRSFSEGQHNARWTITNPATGCATPIPANLVRIIETVLATVAERQAVPEVVIDIELSLEEAAIILLMPQEDLARFVAGGGLPARQEFGRPQLRLADVVAYKIRTDEMRAAVQPHDRE